MIGKAGIIDEDVHRSKFGGQMRDGLLDSFSITNIGYRIGYLHAFVLQFACEGLDAGILVNGGDRSAFAGEIAADGLADASRRPGDGYDLPLEAHACRSNSFMALAMRATLVLRRCPQL